MSGHSVVAIPNNGVDQIEITRAAGDHVAWIDGRVDLVWPMTGDDDNRHVGT
jgi:hypothetical protein